MYEVINEKLGIKACGLGDLTAQQMQSFLGQWEDGATIGTLTLFYENETGDVVLNKDNKQYEFYLELAEGYLGASEENREEFRKKCPVSIQETVKVLEACIKTRKVKTQLYLLNHQRCIEDEYDMPFELRREIEKEYSHCHPRFWMFKAFQYGVMQGKKMERAKKKRQSLNFGE